MTRRLRAGLLLVAAAAAATAGCSILIGVSGDPIVVGVVDDGGALEGGDEADSAIAQDAAPAADGATE